MYPWQVGGPEDEAPHIDSIVRILLAEDIEHSSEHRLHEDGVPSKEPSHEHMQQTTYEQNPVIVVFSSRVIFLQMSVCIMNDEHQEDSAEAELSSKEEVRE